MKREMTAELTGWKHELVLLEGQGSAGDGGKRLKTATVGASSERRDASNGNTQ